MKLSVIVPSYNVSNYLEECIESIVDQEIASMEILIVNDGSTDNTLEIAKKLEKEFEQVRVIDQPNGGLGNARNTGMKQAIGEYLTFVDSDDVIKKDSYRLMLNTIEASGSDFVIGNVVRFNSIKTYKSVLHRRIFTEDLIGVNMKTHPELIYDTTAWNKVFRMSFWRKYGFSFPENMLYEDIPVSIPAHAVAEKVDVLTKVVYKWRSRDTGDVSITQQRSDIDNFKDRIKGIDMVLSFFDKYHISQSLRNDFDYKNLSMDFPLYLSHMLDVDKEYRKLLKNYIANYMKHVSHETFMDLFLLQRIKYRLIEQNRFKDFLKLIKRDKKKENILPPVKVKGGLSFSYPFIDILDETERIADVEFDPISWIEEAKWVNHDLRISGVAYLNKLNSTLFNKTKCKVFLLNELNGNKIVLYNNLKLKIRPDVTLKKGRAIDSKIPFKRMFNYNFSGYEITIPKTTLENLEKDVNYSVMIELTNSGIVKEICLKSPKKGFKTKPVHKKLDSTIVSPKYNANWQLFIRNTSVNNSIKEITINDDYVSIEGTTTSKDNILEMRSEKSNLFHEFKINKTNDNFKVNISKKVFFDIINSSTKETVNELLYFKFPDTNILTQNNSDQLEILGILDFWQLTVIPSHDGFYRLRLGELLPVVTDLKNTDTGFEFNFNLANCFFDNSKDYHVILQGENSSITLENRIIEKTDQITSFSVLVPIINNFEDLRYKLFIINELNEKASTNLESIRKDNQKNNYTGQKLEYESTRNIQLLPITMFNIGKDKALFKEKGIKYQIYHPYGKNQLSYKISSYWEQLDDGPRRKEVIKQVFYPIWRHLPVKKNYCILESFWGREFSDNPKALYDYLNVNKPEMHYIIPLKNPLEKIDYNIQNTEIVKINSWRYIYYLARSKYFVNNVNFPNYYIKRNNVIEIQTMHGTPLKKLGLDNPGEIPLHKMDKFVEKCGRWDYLTIPSDYVGEIAKSAYGFSNEFLKVGYPRNDSLFHFNSNVKKELLEKYNLPKNKKIILYAPTWRVKGKFSMPMDLLRMKEELGNEYVLIIKLHHYMVKNFSLDGVEDFAYVFGKNSQISDFYKLADMLITDYSSVMFDFAILRKPMVFFTYDYENYKNNLRELYFDFKEEAPGPMVETTESLIEEIKDIGSFKLKYSARIQKFNEKFVQYDKGKASESVVHELME